jgi:F-type H+-transporting ATPase subunit a
VTGKKLGIPSLFLYTALALLIILLLFAFIGGPLGSKLLSSLGIDYSAPEWMKLSTPHHELAPEVIFQIGSFGITNTIVTGWISALVLIIISVIIAARMTLVPGRIQALFEFIISAILNLCESIAGKKYGRKVFPIVATIILFIFVNAWMSLIPGYGSIWLEINSAHVPLLRGANTDINVPLALAVVAFFTVWYFGFKSHGYSYLGKFFQFKKMFKGLILIIQGKLKSGLGTLFFGLVDVFVGLLELLSDFIRIISFTFRLFGNMTAGEILILSISFLVPWVLPVLVYGLEMIVGFVQALAFGLLVLIFTAIAVKEHDELDQEAS